MGFLLKGKHPGTRCKGGGVCVRSMTKTVYHVRVYIEIAQRLNLSSHFHSVGEDQGLYNPRVIGFIHCRRRRPPFHPTHYLHPQLTEEGGGGNGLSARELSSVYNPEAIERKIRVGWVSRFFHKHPVGLLSEGIIEKLPRDK